MNIVAHRKIFYIISGILFVASLLALVFWKLNFGIDFVGGSLSEIEFAKERAVSEEIKIALADLNLGEINVQPSGERDVILRFKHIDESTHRAVIDKLDKLEKYGPVQEKRFETIGPVIGREMKERAIWAIVLVLIMIIFYIAWAFRQVSRPVSSFHYGLTAIVALLHDVIIPTGVFSILGHFAGAEINLLFVTGLLTVLGFSVHDTIVVFDRIRENLRRGLFKDFETTINESIKQTLARSINTSLTVLLTAAAIYFFGGETTKYFVLLLMIGIFFGTYSSIFIASPLLVSWQKFKERRTT